ncbi:class I SAM-dependent DNA methyltransferase [Pseudonocardia sp. ICBG1034]|uniref:class I SAM-dependent DNA methyltransferase n=1 Tax=Pseudonocardia sp. ICBG1034 TaxID=2844381 RepID=UPI001CCF45CB|nr:class I SAM-dependent DNA methyltransferase [Pseudonocardia sp. ICBG1034]
MSGSDAILVGESWISEHYFGSEATAQSFHTEVLARRKTWDAEEKADRPTPRTRFTKIRQKLEVDLAALAELADRESAVVHDSETVAKAAREVYTEIVQVLELRQHGLQVAETGPLWRISAAGITERAPLAVVLARPAATHEDALAKDQPTLLEPLALEEDGPEFTSAARLVSALFVDESAAPDLALILAGRWIILAEQERWAEGRYLAVDLQLICERNETKRGGEIDRALTCLSAESVAPDAAGKLWWLETLEKSVKHTVGVSKDLREGVRLSIEIIANEVVARRKAQGLDPLPGADANELAKQSLRFLYRVLFLLYAEASPELGVLPAGAAEYDAGYSLDRLRELVQVELATPRAQAGTHLCESLSVLFGLVDTGHTPAVVESESDDEDEAGPSDGLHFNALRADLFLPKATRFIDAVGLGNAALQKVLAHLLLSKERSGKDRGFISYAELGINQLGAVYEGLMSYTGFFAETDLYEVAKGGDSSKGSWVVPVSRSEGIAAADFVKAEDPRTGEKKPVLHQTGSFVFRLAGRERQQSASYYTPEVLTRFTVGQALEELLDQDGSRTSAEEILSLTVCEPALGSGAFAIEAVRQLAEQYLKRRQEELGERIDPDEYPRRLQEVKAYLALHNVYGVDLNATAVELAEISLWLDTMVSGLSAPWFGLHLKRGNSLIGARRAVYRRSQVADKSWLSAVPKDLPLTSLPADIEAGRIASDLGDGIHHFLLPADGWGAAADAKEAASLVPDAVKKLKTWRGSTKTKPSKAQVAALAELANRVEALWQISYRRLHIAEQQIRRSIPVWGAGSLPAGGEVTREEIEASLADESGAYRRLRRVMDAWTALWFWPLTDAAVTVDGARVEPPTVDQWIAGLQALLGRNPEFGKEHTRKAERTAGQISLGEATNWEELGEAEELALDFAGARPIKALLVEHPWLVVCERVARQQGFFHWNLDFATVFAAGGGFDLQVGNPPWVRPDDDLEALLAERDPWWELAPKPSQSEKSTKRAQLLTSQSMRASVVEGLVETASLRSLLGSAQQYPHTVSLRPDLYRCFMAMAWRHHCPAGISGLVHPESHFTEQKAAALRGASYRHLRRHWQFLNELALFEIDNHVTFGVHIYGRDRGAVNFLQAASIYTPETIVRSFAHDGSGPPPGAKDRDGNWNIQPHRSRILHINEKALTIWHAILEVGDGSQSSPRMIYAVNPTIMSTLEALSDSTKVGSLSIDFSMGWEEFRDRVKGRFDVGWATPGNWQGVILQGPHIHVLNPAYKTPNPSLRSNRDWSSLDHETLAANFIPATSYQPAKDIKAFHMSFTSWNASDERIPASGFYRVAWRAMAANTGERTLIPTVIPPGPTHLNGLFAVGGPSISNRDILRIAASASSLLADLLIRTSPKSGIGRAEFERTPLVATDFPLLPDLLLRAGRLVCVSQAYSDLWDSVTPSGNLDWTGGISYGNRQSLIRVDKAWTQSTPLRRASDRTQAQVEIDALVALSMRVSADQLASIYETQFAVLYGYDRNTYFYDANGRLVPNSVLTVWRRKGDDKITEEERTATNQAGNTYVYELPFQTLDREHDMRVAYAEFERRLAERS